MENTAGGPEINFQEPVVQSVDGLLSDIIGVKID